MQIHSYCTKRAYFDSVIKKFYDFYASTHSLAYLQFLALSLPPSPVGLTPHSPCKTQTQHHSARKGRATCACGVDNRYQMQVGRSVVILPFHINAENMDTKQRSKQSWTLTWTGRNWDIEGKP
jgi:hypothetical protein